jgi:hypothetical protein
MTMQWGYHPLAGDEAMWGYHPLAGERSGADGGIR